MNFRLSKKALYIFSIFWILSYVHDVHPLPDIHHRKPQVTPLDEFTRIGKEGWKTLRKLDISSMLFPESSTKEFSKTDLDNVFAGISDIWNGKNSLGDNDFIENMLTTKPTPTNPSTKTSTKSTTAKFPTQNTKSTENGTTTSNMEPAWRRFKAILGNMKSMLKYMNDDQTTGFEHVFETVDKIVQVGDNINIADAIKNNFDADMLDFFSLKWNNTKERIKHSYPVFDTLAGISQIHLPKSVLYAAVQQIGNLLHQQAFEHFRESEFIIDIMKTSGFKMEEIREVFKLLHLPSDALYADADFSDFSDISDIEKRSVDRDYYDYRSRDSGYGHSSPSGGHGGYGGGGGYMMDSFDPFILLAGLGAATFGAYILYRLLSSTTARRKRSNTDFDMLALDLSDVPTILDNFYSYIGKAEQKIEGDDYINAETLSGHANELWRNFNKDRMSTECVRKYLCDSVEHSISNIMSPTKSMTILVLSSLSSVMGLNDSGKYTDDLTKKALEGDDLKCQQIVCDGFQPYKRLNKNYNNI